MLDFVRFFFLLCRLSCLILEREMSVYVGLYEIIYIFSFLKQICIVLCVYLSQMRAANRRGGTSMQLPAGCDSQDRAL